jgi:acetolactate synthase-1/2/3 large subunit
MSSEEAKKGPFKGGDLLIKALLNEKVKYMFGLPGGQFLPMYDALFRWGCEAGIKTINVRHEQAGAHMADAYARVSGQVGVCFGTVGPGATHMVPGVATAWADNVPLLAISPQISWKMTDKSTLQGDLDQIAMYAPITKFTKRIQRAAEIIPGVQRAFRAMLGNCPGAVFLEVSEDAMFEDVPGGSEIVFMPPAHYRFTNGGRSAGDPALVKQATEILKRTQKPVIVVGGGFVNGDAFDLLKTFADTYKIPVATTRMGIGCLSTDDPQYIGATLGNASVMKATRECDVILALGCKFSYSMGFGEAPIWNPAAKLIQVDINPMIIGRNRPVEVGIVGDAGLVLQQIANELKSQGGIKGISPDWLSSIRSQLEMAKTAVKAKATSDKVPIWPQRLVHDILEELKPDDALIMDGGDISVFVMEQLDHFGPRRPRRTLGSASMGHLGVGIPYCIGARLAIENPDTKVVGIVGDGSFWFNIQDLETAVRCNTPFVIVLANDSAWGMIKSGQQMLFKKRYIDVDLPEGTDYTGIAKAFGCYGEKVTEPSEIKPAFQRALASKKPAIIDVRMGRAIPDGTKILGAIGCL